MFMTAMDLFQDGRLQDALTVQRNVVDEKPSDAAARLLLAELQLFNGEIDSVRQLLDGLASKSPGMDDYLQGFQLLLDAEARRRRMLVDSDPRFLIEPPEHVARRLSALEQLRSGRLNDVVETLDEADALCPVLSGHIDGREFEGVFDADDLFKSVLEVFVDDQYVWFPFEQIRRLRLSRAESLRDYLLVPARLRATNGQEWSAYLPALYPDTFRHPDELVRAGQSTDLLSEQEGPIRGAGLRLITFGEEELNLLSFTQWEKRGY